MSTVNPWGPSGNTGPTTPNISGSPLPPNGGGLQPPGQTGLTPPGAGAVLGTASGGINVPGQWSTTASTAPSTFVNPPMKWLYIAQGLVVAGIVVAFLPWVTDILPALVFTLLGWGLCGVLGLGMAAVFTRKDAEAQANPMYRFLKSTKQWYAITVIFAILGVVICAAQLALVVGRI